MIKSSLTISGKDENEARIKGAEQLNADPKDVTVVRVDETSYTVSLKNAPGRVDVVIRDEKMAAYIEAIVPPIGQGKPVTIEDVEKVLAAQKIVFGLDRDALKNILSDVQEKGDIPKNNIPIAIGQPAEAGKDGRIELKIGREAVNKDSKARNMVKPGQVIAVIVPSTKGVPGINILGEAIPVKPGKEIQFSPGSNVASTDEGKKFTATIYGIARTSRNSVSVDNPVRISDDRMRAEIPIFPTLADNSKLTFEDIAVTLKQAGVVHGVREDLVKKALEAGQPVDSLRIAEGTPVKDGEDDRIEFSFLLNGDNPQTTDVARRNGQLDDAAIIKETVAAGDALAVKIPLKKPVDGLTVTGEVRKGAPPKEKQLKAGTNVTILDDGVTYVVAEGAVGFADLADGLLKVEDPLRVSDDRMHVYLTIHPPSRSGKMLTKDLLQRLLATRGITYGIDWAVIEQALTKASQEGCPVRDALITKGKPPEKGLDARIEFRIGPDKIAGTLIEKSGQINYKERGSIKNVKKGDLLAVKTPTTKGEDGADVFGNVIPAEAGIDKALIPAGNVAVSEDGLEYTSEIDGMVTLMDKDKLGVFKQYEISGDVNYSTGNLKMEGTLQIKGWIRSGFDVHASGDIHVGGGIENANVEAGVSLQVKGGIIGSGEGKIISGGDLTAHFIENARVRARGDISVRGNIVRSIVSAGGSIYVTGGKGRILGGSIEAAKSIESDEIGSEAGIQTRVSAGTDSTIRKRMEDATKSIEVFKRARAKMDMILARYAKMNKGKPLPRETALKLSRVVKLRRDAVTAEARLAKEREELALKMPQADAEPAEIKVKKAVYSGATLLVGGYAYEVRDNIPGKVTFILNAEKQVIELVR